jgi:DNA-directed RNA polymerase specialized sigma24 family protein
MEKDPSREPLSPDYVISVIEAAIDSLPEELRLAFNLYYSPKWLDADGAQRTHADVAECMSITIDQVRYLLKSAMTYLKGSLSDKLPL